MPLDCTVCTRTWPHNDYFIADLGHSKAYLHEDQFLPGWCVLVLKEHFTELFELSDRLRNEVMAEVSMLTKVLQQVFQAAKMNYSLLGNVVPHIHWHLTPRLKNDPAPLEPPFAIKHENMVLNSFERSERIFLIRQQLELFTAGAARENNLP